MKIDIEKLLLTDLTEVKLVNSKGQEYVPIVHGHWERVAEQPYFRKHYHTLCCSECHSEGYAKWKYCPHCGAKMDKDSNYS